jgi:hypothetical protein
LIQWFRPLWGKGLGLHDKQSFDQAWPRHFCVGVPEKSLGPTQQKLTCHNAPCTHNEGIHIQFDCVQSRDAAACVQLAMIAGMSYLSSSGGVCPQIHQLYCYSSVSYTTPTVMVPCWLGSIRAFATKSDNGTKQSTLHL